MNRQPGFYWALTGLGHHTIVEWSGRHWFMFGLRHPDLYAEAPELPPGIVKVFDSPITFPNFKYMET